MKKIFIILVLAVCFVSCQSKEEKAAELVRVELIKTISNFDSYIPIETTVEEAKFSEYNDTVCWNKAQELLEVHNAFEKKSKEAEVALKNAKMYSPEYIGRYYYSYHEKRFNKYMAEFHKKDNEAAKLKKASEGLVSELKDYIDALDSDKSIGWEVFHNFRYNKADGELVVANYRYVVDEDFEKVLFVEDLDSENSKKIRELIQRAMNNEFSEEERAVLVDSIAVDLTM